MHSPSLYRFLTALIVVLLSACTTQPQPQIVPPTAVEVPIIAEARLRVVLTQVPDAPIADRRVALCRITIAPKCEVMAGIATTDAQGNFEINELPVGDYYVLIDSGRGDFAAAVDQWAGDVLDVGDSVWTIRDWLGLGRSADGVQAVDPLAAVNLMESAVSSQLTWEARTRYALDTLMVADSAMMIAHTLEGESAARVVVRVDQVSISANVLTLMPSVVDYAGIRARIGELTRDELRLVDPTVVNRWNAFYSGDDTAYSDGDVMLIEAMRSGGVYLMGDAYLTRIDVFDAGLVKQIGYLVIDRGSGLPTLVGVREASNGDVREISTGYLLNVRDNPGEWIVDGANGEKFYHFGWSYYHRWRRILPSPLITVAESFRTVGAANVTRYLDLYQQAADEYDEGDLTLVDWNPSTEQAAANWSPLATAPPYLSVPDSGTVDVRRERFYEALTSGMVQVDEESVIRFFEDDRAENGFFITEDVTVQTVMDSLTIPYRAGHLYTDFEAALILDATYGGEGPLVIRVTARIDDGVFVPRSRKEISFGDGEVADVILGYSGTLIARWPHEMGHILDFRDARNMYPMRPVGGSRCEPFKYMMEYMWWVERFPYDAPDWDWMPVGSGLTLARLLTGTYPNSGC